MTVWISLIVGGLIIAATLGMAGYWLFRITHKASPPPRHDGAAGNTGNGPSDAPNQGSTKPGNGNKGNNRPSSNATGEESVSAVSETEPPSNRISMVLQRLMADVSGLVQGVRSKALAYDDQLESHQRELETGLEKSDPHALCRTLVAELSKYPPA